MQSNRKRTRRVLGAHHRAHAAHVHLHHHAVDSDETTHGDCAPSIKYACIIDLSRPDCQAGRDRIVNITMSGTEGFSEAEKIAQNRKVPGRPKADCAVLP